MSKDLINQRLVGIGGVKPEALKLVAAQLAARDEIIAGYEHELTTVEVRVEELEEQLAIMHSREAQQLAEFEQERSMSNDSNDLLRSALATAEARREEAQQETAELKKFYHNLLAQAGAYGELLEVTNGHLGTQVKELELELKTMTQIAQTASNGNKERDEHIDKLKAIVRELVKLVEKVADDHICSRHPDQLLCTEVCTKATKLITEGEAAQEPHSK